MTKEIQIGNIVGIYEILGISPTRSKDGHKQLHVRCTCCSVEKDLRQAKLTATVCTHKRVIVPRYCKYCSNIIPYDSKTRAVEYEKRNFCNNSCAASYNNQGVRRNYKNGTDYDGTTTCLYCGAIIKRSGKFCSSKCQQDYQYKEYISKWKNNEIDGTAKYGASKHIRRYLLEKYGNKCCECGWSKVNPSTGKVPVEVHHIDGNYRNNREDNLTLLCPSCHSITPTYKALNGGNGREYRYKD